MAEQIYKLSSDTLAVYFSCRNCGKQLLLERQEGKCTSQLFCPKCSRQYWVSWDEGVLHMGLNGEEEYSRLAYALRQNGIMS